MGVDSRERSCLIGAYLSFVLFSCFSALERQPTVPSAHTNGRNMKIIATLLKYLFSFVIYSIISNCNYVIATTVPWYENLPAVAMDYKVHIDPGKEDCYFQYVNPGATFYVSFQVNYSLGAIYI